MPEGLTIRNAEMRLSDGDRRFRLFLPELLLSSGEAVALTGVSGSGKTLLLELIGLLRKPGDGTVYYWTGPGGAVLDMAGLWRAGPRNAALARDRGRVFGFVPQTGGLLPFLTVAENIALPQRLADRVDADWCAALIDRLGLTDVSEQQPEVLSIGQRQRTAIARALAHRPPFVIADEPTAALDPDSADGVLELLLETAAEQGSGVILSSHDIDRVARFGIERLRLISHADPDGTIQSTLEAGSC